MTLDFILVVITLIVAVIGTLLKDPAKHVKVFLISLAALSSIASIIKAHGDSNEKEFLRKAITSNLAPDAGTFGRFGEQVSAEAKSRGFDRFPCYHDQNTLTCFLSSTTDPAKRGTLVLSRSEVAQMYANEIQRASNKVVISTALSHEYDPSAFDEEFEDKVGLLGAAVFFTTFGHWPSYSYDDHGVTDLTLVYEANGRAVVIRFDSTELNAVPKGNAMNLFYAFEQRFRQEYAKERSSSSAPPSLPAQQ
jgi:hypothetical protein